MHSVRVCPLQIDTKHIWHVRGERNTFSLRFIPVMSHCSFEEGRGSAYYALVHSKDLEIVGGGYATFRLLSNMNCDSLRAVALWKVSAMKQYNEIGCK